MCAGATAARRRGAGAWVAYTVGGLHGGRGERLVPPHARESVCLNVDGDTASICGEGRCRRGSGDDASLGDEKRVTTYSNVFHCILVIYSSHCPEYNIAWCAVCVMCALIRV
jgi:hypothetical protein